MRKRKDFGYTIWWHVFTVGCTLRFKGIIKLIGDRPIYYIKDKGTTYYYKLEKQDAE